MKEDIQPTTATAQDTNNWPYSLPQPKWSASINTSVSLSLVKYIFCVTRHSYDTYSCTDFCYQNFQIHEFAQMSHWSLCSMTMNQSHALFWHLRTLLHDVNVNRHHQIKYIAIFIKSKYIFYIIHSQLCHRTINISTRIFCFHF